MEMPYDKETEEDCLGSMMICTYYFTDPEYGPLLTVDDFYLLRHKLIYSTMLKLNQLALEPHVTNVKIELTRIGKLAQVGGIEFLIHLGHCANSRTSPPGYNSSRVCNPFYIAPILHSLKLRRDALIKAQAMAQAALDFSRPMQVES